MVLETLRRYENDSMPKYVYMSVEGRICDRNN